MNPAGTKSESHPNLIVEIAVILCCKLAFIFGLWYLFFGPEKRVEQTPETIASAVLERTDSAREHTP